MISTFRKDPPRARTEVSSLQPVDSPARCDVPERMSQSPYGVILGKAAQLALPAQVLSCSASTLVTPVVAEARVCVRVCMVTAPGKCGFQAAGVEAPESGGTPVAALGTTDAAKFGIVSLLSHQPPVVAM